jgi:hypothetical protein
MLVCVACKGTGLIFRIAEGEAGKALVEECPDCNG